MYAAQSDDAFNVLTKLISFASEFIRSVLLPNVFAKKSAANLLLPVFFNTYQPAPPIDEALTDDEFEPILGNAATAHFPLWSSAALIEGAIQQPVITEATSPLLNAPTN